MNNLLIDAWQNFYYGLLKHRPSIDFSEIPASIDFVSHYDDKNGIHWVEAPELPEFYATGKTAEELAKNIGDTLLVYYDIPRYFAKKWQDGVFTFTNQKTGQRETVQVNKKELDRVLA